MNTSRRKKSLAFVVNQGVAILTAGAFLFSSLGANAAEATFWEERAAARSRQIQGASAPLLLAQLPVSQPLSFGGTAQTVLPSFSPKLSTLLATAPRWAQGAVTSFADIRSVREGASGSLRVFLVMDAHDVYSAQRNIARLLAHLGKQGKMLVGIEGTSGAFDLERHRGLLPGAGQGQLVNHLLKKGFLNGPEAFGLTAEKTPDFWGVEDAALYDANVQAYRDTLSIEVETQSALQKLKKETLERQAKLFSPELQALEREVQAMHEDRGDLGKYVKAVLEGAGVEKMTSPHPALRATFSQEEKENQQVRRFVEAKSKEDSLSFPAVEQARAAFIERVSPRLSPFELEALVKKTTAFRAGSVSAKDYYRDLVSVALSKGVPVSAYPAFQSYIEYVSLTDGLDVVALMDEMEEIEGRAYGRLAKGDARPLAEWSKDLRLAERAVQHAMTPREWTQYEERRGELARLADRAVSLGMSQDSAEVAQKNLPRFAAFFEAATARNHTLLENALAQAHQRGATTVVLVTGGFHAPALEKLLNQKNISHMVLSPRIEEVPDSAAGYLGAFAPTRTPLEKLLLGDRLFMNPPSATAASVAEPTNPFHQSGTALANGTLVYGAALAGSGEKLKSFVDLWNKRFGNFGHAIVRFVKGLIEIRLNKNKGAVLLLAASETNGGISGNSDYLDQGITDRGGKVVEQGQIGDIRYSLGGRNITSIFPESIAALGFVILYWGSALSPPMYAVGVLGWMVLGGIFLRAILLGTHHLHEMGHALPLQWLGGQSVRKSWAQYSESISLKQIIPFSNIFIPGLTPEAHSPRITADGLSTGWKTRFTALMGPAMNLVALSLLYPLAMTADPVSAQQLLLASAAGFNLWATITSVHDMQSAVTGFATFFACGVVSGRFVISNPDSEAIPNFVEAEARQSFVHTTPRGFQGGGGGFVVKRILEDGTVVYEFVVSKRAKEWDRRESSSDMLNDVMERLNQKARDGNYEGDDVVAYIGHSRLGTNDAEQEERNAHPFTSQVRLQPIAYIGNQNLVSQSEKYWLPPKENPVLKITTQNRGVLAAANGDDNKTVLTVVPVTFDQTSHSYVEGSEIVYMSNGEDALLSEYLTGVKNVADGDSPQIPTRLDRWTSIGSVRDSLRLALSQVGFDYLGNHYQRYANIQQGKGIEFPFSTIQQFQPSPERVSALMLTKAMDTFHQQVEGLVSDYASVSNLRELYAKLGAVVEDPGQGSDPKKVGKVWNLGDAVPLKASSEIETLRNQLANSAKGFLTTMEWFNEASDADQERYSVLFADLFLKFYFTQDFRSAGINFLRRADLTSTYGVAALSLSQPKDPMWMCLRQDYYLWVTEDGKNVTGTSASKAHLRQREGGARFRYRLTMRDGEVATLNGRKLVIDHMDQGRVAEFDLDNLAAEQNGDSLVNMKSRWLDLDHSPFVKRTTGEVTPHEERTLTDFKMIPKVEAGISEDFKDKGRGKNSNNRLSGLAFVKLVLAAKKKLRRGTSSVESLDLVIVGLEKSFDAGDLFRKAVLKLASMAGRPLKVEIINAAEFVREDLVSLRDKGFGPETVVLGLSSSGQTANTMYVLNNLHDAWRFLLEKNETGSSGGKTPPHFLVSADMDNAYTENVLGQGYHEGDPFLARNFVTFPGNLDSFHPSEASTVTDKATRFLLNELLLLTAIDLDRVKKRREGQGSNVRSLSAIVHPLLNNQAETNREIVGVDENDRTMPIKSSTVGGEKDIPEQVEIVKNRLKQRFLETLWGVVVAAPLFVTLTLVFHQTPASLLLGGWFPNALFVFADGLPVLAVIVGVVGVAVAYWKARAWKWDWPFQVLGVVMVSCVSLLGGEVVVVGLNAISQSLGWGLWGSRWGVLPIILDVSPINLLNILSYIFFTFGFIHLLRWIQKRPTIDRLGPMVLVFSDYEKSTGRSISRLYQRLYSLRYGWMGPSSTNFSSEGEFTHGELNNSGGRGTIVVHGEGRGEESSGASKNKNIAGGLPKGRGAKILQIGVGHRPHSEGIANYDLYISLFKEGDDISERDPDVAALQEYIYDAQVRHTVLMRLGVVITDEISNIRPLNFPTGTANEASASTTAQPKSLIPTEVVERIFNVNEITATRKGPNSRDSLNSLAEFLGLTEFSNLSMPDLKKGIREALNSREADASPIPGVHEEALLSALAGKVGGATAVRIRLGNGSEDPSVTIAKYRKLRNLGELEAPESLIVGFTETEGFVVRLVSLSEENGEQPPVPSTNGTGAPSHSENQSGTVVEAEDLEDGVPGEKANTETEQGVTESPNLHGTDLAGLTALADFLGIPSSDLDTVEYLKGQIRIHLMNRATADIPAVYVAPLLEVLKGAPEAYLSRVSIQEGNSNNSLGLHDISARSQEFPKGPSYRVTHDEENVFHLSLSPLEAVRVEENPSRSIPVPWGGVAQPREALLDLATYLNLGVDDVDSDVLVAEKIEGALKSPEKPVQIPGEYSDGLIAVLAQASTRQENPAHVNFNQGIPNGFPINLDSFISRRSIQIPWENYYVSFNVIAPGLSSFLVFPFAEEESEGENSEMPSGISPKSAVSDVSRDASHETEEKPSGEESSEKPSGTSPEDAVIDVSRDPSLATEEKPSGEESSETPSGTSPEDAVIDVSRDASHETEEKPSGEESSEKPSGTSPEDAVIDVSRDPSHATEEKPSRGGGEEAGWREFYRTYFLQPLLNIARVTVTVFGLVILLTSWGGTVLSSVEWVFTQAFEKTEAVQSYFTSVNGGAQGVDSKIPENAPRAFVSTKQTPLMSFDRNPSEKNRVVVRVGARSSVKIVERKGNWVLVSTVSGKQGWVKVQFLEKGTGERTRVVQRVALLEHTPPLRMANLPRGAELAVLDVQGKWAKVVPVQNSASPVWVSREYILNVPPAQSSKVKAVPPGVKVDSSRAGTILLQLGKPVPVLGQMARRALDAIGSQNSPGFVLHQRLLAGSLQEFKAGPTREMAEALVSFVDHPGTSSMDSVEQQMVLALGYGAVAGESWSQAGAPKDRALYDDYRRTRTATSRGSLSASAGRALTRLARRASGWNLSTTPTFAPGALPVINLSEEGQNSSLISQWAAAVARGDRDGEPAPVMVARNERQKAQLLAALKEWLIAHEEIKLSDEAIGKSPWVFLDDQEENVVLRDGEGNPQTVRLGAMLNAAHINLDQIPAGIDVVSRPGTSLTWDRSDVPQNIVVRLIIGLLNTVSLSASLEEAQIALRSARRAQTAA